jgi:two-component system KDP operon response regulator KdpE
MGETSPAELTARILLVEDDPVLLAVLEAALAHGGFTSASAADGAQAMEQIEGGSYDAVLLDLGLPDCDGRDLLERMRAVTDLPILVVSGQDSERDRIDALDRGADDFVPKPFLPGELLARIRAALRRFATPAAGEEDVERQPLRVGALTLDPLDCSASLHGLKIQLNAAEYRILAALALRAGEVVPRAELAGLFSGDGGRAESKVIDVYMSRIRNKLRSFPEGDDLIANARARGWRLRPPG